MITRMSVWLFVVVFCATGLLTRIAAGAAPFPRAAPGSAFDASYFSARTMRIGQRPASSFRTIYSFKGSPDGASPYAGLLCYKGRFYGTTLSGGAGCSGDYCGTVYAITPEGAEKVIHTFGVGVDGASPIASLIEVNGELYGTTLTDTGGGCNNFGCGSVFKISSSGTESVVYFFKGGSDGIEPHAALTDFDGVLYGTTYLGGTFCPREPGCGTIFAVTTSGKEHVLHSFGGVDEGFFPVSPLTVIAGKLYSTTMYGGNRSSCDSEPGSCGLVFSINKSGSENVLYDFLGQTFTDGADLLAGVIYENNTVYGTTNLGGAGDCKGDLIEIGCGTVYSLDSAGRETVVYSFQGGNDGQNPQASLIEVNGSFYGTTKQGGGSAACSSGCGTVFKVTAGGGETVLHAFKGSPDGAYPLASLTFINGKLYGTTTAGGAKNLGTVFALKP